MSQEELLIRSVRRLTNLIIVLIWCVAGVAFIFLGIETKLFTSGMGEVAASVSQNAASTRKGKASIWVAPDVQSIPDSPEGALIEYGKELIEHTSVYLGPNGKISPISNGMNCQNCHLKAGTVPYGNNYGKVSSSYPKFRNRSGTVEGYVKRINDCIERSLNGKGLDADSREMQAITAYLKWVGKDVSMESNLPGFGLVDLKPLDRPASPEKGKLVYDMYCGRCHGENGEGIMAANGVEWTYPPLFGENSYNIGAGLYRLSRFAAFVKANMPYGVSYDNPFLSDEEAWDVAAYVNSMPRPDMDISNDWPDITTTPVDHPFGPYTDTFSEEQHKYGPFEPIKASIQ